MWHFGMNDPSFSSQRCFTRRCGVERLLQEARGGKDFAIVPLFSAASAHSFRGFVSETTLCSITMSNLAPNSHFEWSRFDSLLCPGRLV